MATNNAINNKTVDASLFIGNTAASSSSSYLEFRKSRSGGVITSGDGLGNISFAAYDGSNYITTSQILSFSGGTIAANRIASNLQFFTHPDSTNPSTLRMAISSTGTVTILSPDNAASTLELNGNQVAQILNMTQSVAGGTGAILQLIKNRSGGVITSGDTLGEIRFFGNDGSSNIQGSVIKSVSSGTIAANRVASNLQFFTHPDSTTASTLRMTIGAAGNVTIAAPDSGVGLTVSGGGANITGAVTASGTILSTGGNVSTTNGNLNCGNTADSTADSILNFIKSRSGGVITTGDYLGKISFTGFDGASNISAGFIEVQSTGTIASNRVAGIMTFATHPDSTTNAIVRMTIGAAGNVTIATPDSGVGLTVSGGGATITGTAVATQIAASGDTGGTASQNTITNATNTSLSSGTLSIKSTTTNNGNNAGFIKVYVGTTVAYIPYFTNIAP